MWDIVLPHGAQVSAGYEQGGVGGKVHWEYVCENANCCCTHVISWHKWRWGLFGGLLKIMFMTLSWLVSRRVRVCTNSYSTIKTYIESNTYSLDIPVQLLWVILHTCRHGLWFAHVTRIAMNRSLPIRAATFLARLHHQASCCKVMMDTDHQIKFNLELLRTCMDRTWTALPG